MRIIKILLLSLLLLNTNLSVAEDSTDVALYKIIKNGWSEDNKRLNQKIISYYEKKRPKILKSIKEPLKENKKLDKYGMPQLPKMLLTRQDYLYILAYTKYLEKQGKFAESLDINIEILKGLNNRSDNFFITLIFHTVVESFVRDSLFELIKDNKNFKIGKKQFNEIKNSLILDKTHLINAVKQEQSKSIKFTNIILKDLNSKNRHTTLYNLLSSITKETNRQIKLFYKKVFKSIEKGTSQALKKLKKEITKFKKENMCKALKVSDYDELAITTKEETVKLLLCTTLGVSYFYVTIQEDYFKTLKDNKLLLDRLKLRVK